MVEAYCDSCEANFTVKFEMDDNRYQVAYCPFCKSPLDEVVECEQENE